MNQIERVIQVTNMPSKADIDAVASPFAATMLETLPVMNYKTIPETFPTATPDGLDVLNACFHFNPDKRPSAEELLKHVFVAEFHNEEEEPNFPGGTSASDNEEFCTILLLCAVECDENIPCDLIQLFVSIFFLIYSPPNQYSLLFPFLLNLHHISHPALGPLRLPIDDNTKLTAAQYRLVPAPILIPSQYIISSCTCTSSPREYLSLLVHRIV